MKSLAQIEPRTPIGELPFTIRASGSYYLTTNLTSTTAGNGIVIEASDVTLDLSGFALIGAAGSSNGIHVASSQSNLLIRNGTVSRWAVGINGRGATRSRFESLRLADNRAEGLLGGELSAVVASEAYGNGGSGLGLDQVSRVSNCAADRNGLHGIVVGMGSQVSACNASRNSGSGIVVNNSSTVNDCLAFYNGAAGVFASEDLHLTATKLASNGGSGLVAGPHATVNNCTATGNLDVGFTCGANAQLIDCKAVTNTRGIVVLASSTVRGCSARQNGGDGIAVSSQCTVLSNSCTDNFLARDASGIRATGTDNSIQDNNVASNDMGLLIEAGGNLIFKNTAANNSLNYRINGTQMMGPIVTATPLPDTTNPFSNFEF